MNSEECVNLWRIKFYLSIDSDDWFHPKTSPKDMFVEFNCDFSYFV